MERVGGGGEEYGRLSNEERAISKGGTRLTGTPEERKEPDECSTTKSGRRGPSRLPRKPESQGRTMERHLWGDRAQYVGKNESCWGEVLSLVGGLPFIKWVIRLYNGEAGYKKLV